ncbi:MAG: C-GCAxxG-C-C family protein [Deltaproteobacteria bacterium]|jgi:hypothetical protein|nr:C-GCAxxG-C-C family protein [Deltaproteobacteria bacterium]
MTGKKGPDGGAVSDLAGKAALSFRQGLDCEAAVLTALNDYLGTKAQGGPAGKGLYDACGALAGAKLVLAEAMGGDPGLPAASRELEKLFAIRHKGTACRFLTSGMGLGDHRPRCGQYVRSAVECLMAVLPQAFGPKGS